MDLLRRNYAIRERANTTEDFSGVDRSNKRHGHRAGRIAWAIELIAFITATGVQSIANCGLVSAYPPDY